MLGSQTQNDPGEDDFFDGLEIDARAPTFYT
jgi:hypothetical protein